MDFFVVGQPKAGTTALYEMLSQHPEIFMPKLKEPQFFATDMRRRFDPKGWPVLPQTLGEYEALFAGAEPGQLRGEASTLYLPSRVAAGKIAAFNPTAKAIAVLREPASLLRSLHLQTLKDRNENEKDFSRALELEPMRRNGKKIPRTSYRPQEILYTTHVHYVEQLERFDTLEVLVLLYDDLRADNQSTARKVFDFLGVKAIDVATVEANPSVVVRSHTAGKALHRISTGRTRWLGRAIPRDFRRRALEATYRKIRTAPPPPDPTFMAALRSRFRPEVEKLADYLGREDLPTLWAD